MKQPRQPRLPKITPEAEPKAPHPLHRPDERKEGGPDFGKADKQHENRRKAEDEAESQAED